ncbi:Hypothetical protein R9X50_00556200 [Acrodontium crateriforme]|uniref:Protein CFT1 n=1 Tax=Acrodontium crateriforme TaxID=150365 RepID=A0AAQ3M9W1_9PEZI|nr:Hypothetical protein R9X50_00556200 [Acrodontium crateriforme]
MQCYTELVPPTAVTHSVALPFLDPNANNLVVAKSSLLQVFNVTDVSFPPVAALHEPVLRSKLVLIGEYPLAGTVTALAAVKTLNTRTGGDAILISFQNAKLSLVEWDAENYRTSTISIHYYEGDNIISQPFGPSLSDMESMLTVDPSSRCAALKFGARHLAILPFRQQGDDLGEGPEGDDFDVDMDTSPALKRTASGLNGEQASETDQTPYKASFVLPLTALDPLLTHTVDLTFLHGYREPTFGVLFSSIEPSMSLYEDRVDCLSYTVFTLDLEQRASTNLMSVPKLPSGLWKVVPMPLPVGGALLVGTNELIHVDQSGKTNAVAVNEFASKESNFNMLYQADLNIKLEDCEIDVLDPASGEVLVMLNDGSAAILSFKLFGRTVGGLTISRIPNKDDIALVEGLPSTVSVIRGNAVFVGSDSGDSKLLTWTKQSSSSGRKRSHAQMMDEVTAEYDAEDVDDIDDDDLYAPSKETVKHTVSTSGQGQAVTAAVFTLELQDTLHSLGPINNVCMGRSSHGHNNLDMYAAVGQGKASRLAIINREIPTRSNKSATLREAKDIWSVQVQSNASNEGSRNSAQHHNMLFAFDGESTRIFDIEASQDCTSDAENNSLETLGYKERTGSEFEHEGETLSVFTLANNTKIMQCRRTEVRTYDAALGLSQIIPMMHEETDAELKIVATSYCDPYVLIIRDDSSLQILNVDRSGDVEPLDNENVTKEHKWLSGCLYSGALTKNEPCVFLLNQEGALHVLSLPDLKLCYSAPTLPHLPPVLSANATQRRVGARETLTELVIANLGTDGSHQPYMILRNSVDDLTIYEPFYYNSSTQASAQDDFSSLRFRKVPNLSMPKYDETLSSEEGDRPSPLQAMRIGQYHTIYVPGSTPSFVIKESMSRPHVIGLRATKIRSLTSLSRQGSESHLALVNKDGLYSEHELLPDASYATGWSTRTIRLGTPNEEVRYIAYHDERKAYIVATCRNTDFLFPEEDGRHPEQDDITLRPQIPLYTVYIISAKTQEVVGTVEMPYTETITALKVMSLEVSEHTHEQRSMVVVGSAALRGEDMPARGAVTVFDIINVVPDPDRPETGIKLKIFSREETKGAITAVDAFPGGLIGTAQGQKIIVRGLKEDGSCLPVAFLDAQCHTSTLKSLGKSGMWLAADAWKGLWFGGFTEEPYRLTTLSKSITNMEVMTAEFLPFDGQLFLLVIDASMDLHVLQYDPENPKSLSGQRLLHRCTFHLGHFPSSMTLVPSTLAPFTEQAQQVETNGNDEMEDGETLGSPAAPAPPLNHMLITTQTGSIGLLTPVDEDTYRRLSALQTHLTSILEHAAGLNPRAYRESETSNIKNETAGVRGGVVDGSLVQRIGELGSARRAEVLGRAGADGWMLRSDLEIIGGGGLGYL